MLALLLAPVPYSSQDSPDLDPCQACCIVMHSAWKSKTSREA